jgi:hypothetical protein
LKDETVRRDLRHRLLAVEIGNSIGVEIWLDQGCGTVRGPHGEQVTREEAEVLSSAGGILALFLSEADSRL